MDGNMNDTRDEQRGLQPQTARSDRARSRHGQDSRGFRSEVSVAENASSATIGDNALPDRIRRKYYVVANEPGKEGTDGEARLYADERGEYLAFKVTDDRLVTRLAAAEVIRDMVSVAQHRQWASLRGPRLRGIPS